MNARHIIATGAVAAATVLAIPVGTAGAQTPTTCLLHVHPWDSMSRRLEVVHADGTVEVLLSVQDNRTTIDSPTFEIASSVRRVHWTWNRAAGAWRVDLGVAPGCQMEQYPFWQDGSHPASLSMSVGQVPTTTTAPPEATTTTAPPVTTTAPPTTSTTAGPTGTTRPAPIDVQRVTPTSVVDSPAAPAAPMLPATGRRTWPQVRLSLALVVVGVAALQLARIMQQDEEMGR